jgi:hypothetical protein
MTEKETLIQQLLKLLEENSEKLFTMTVPHECRLQRNDKGSF